MRPASFAARMTNHCATIDVEPNGSSCVRTIDGEHVDELARAERDPVRLRARALDDRLRVRPLVEAALVEERGERALAVADRPRVLGLGAEEMVDRADDRRGVDPAGEAGADRDVAAQAQADRVEEELAHLVGRRRRVASRGSSDQ